LLRREASGASEPEELLRASNVMRVRDWSRDGRYLLFSTSPESAVSGAAVAADLLVLPLSGGAEERKPIGVVTRPFNQDGGRISPDGKWLAYRSNESGSTEIYVQPFSVGGKTADTRWQISTNTASDLAWRADSRAVYFENSSTAVVSGISESTFATDAAGPRWTAPRVVIPTGVLRLLEQGFDVGADGRFLVVQALPGAEAGFTVTIDWPALLRRP
jgi:Tol biopolymer transport system component